MEGKNVGVLTIAKASFVSSTLLSHAWVSAIARLNDSQRFGIWMKVENRRKFLSNECNKGDEGSAPDMGQDD